MVRVGDVFECGVLASAPDAGVEPLVITITATVTAPANKTSSNLNRHRRILREAEEPVTAIRLQPTNPYSRKVTLSAAKQQRTVRFRFNAVAVGETGLRFDAHLGFPAKEAAKTIDSASFDVPVLSRQRPVFVATSFALQAGANNTEEPMGQAEGLKLPAAELGSGSVDLVAGVGNLPFLQVSSISLMMREGAMCVSSPSARQ